MSDFLTHFSVPIAGQPVLTADELGRLGLERHTGAPVRRRRFADAELAAEYQRMSHEFDIAKYGLECDPYPGRTPDSDEAGDRATTLHRFATSPHYSEEDS